MRPYKPKDNVQKQSYYTDRFWVAPRIPKEDVEGDEVFAKDLAVFKAKHTVLEAFIERGQMVVWVNPEENLDVLTTARDVCGYDILTEMSAIDFVARKQGFEIFYQMLCMEKRKRIRIKCFLPEGQAINSAAGIFKSADWAEREMYDMFGIKPNNHPFPKRILMPDDWEGYPLLKTYPLHGDEAAQWYEVDKIFGREYRDVIGPENRDPAMVDEKDTFNFARIGHEVEFGAETGGETPVRYQEEKKPFMIAKFDPAKTKVLKERK